MPEAIDDYLDNVKKLAGVQQDSELAELLGKAKQTVSSWRRRGNVPLDVQYELADRFGPDAAMLREVVYATSSRERQVIVAIWLALYDWYRSAGNPRESESRYIDWAQALLHCENDIRDAVRSFSFNSGRKGHPYDQHTLAELVRVMINTGQLPEAKRAIDIYVRGVAPDDEPPGQYDL